MSDMSAIGPASSIGAPALVWHKLHPLTPVISAGRSVLVLAVVALEDSRTKGPGALVTMGVLGLLAIVSLAFGAVKYMVTRWALDGATLRIETGLLRRDLRQLPLARIQAVDLAKPFLARAVGLAELRIRLAGSGRAGGRLAYLSEPVATDLRARLLAGHYGLDQATPKPPARPAATVPTGRLVASAILSPATAIALALVVAIVVLFAVSPTAGAATAGSLVVYVFVFGTVTWRRVSEQYGFSVGLAPDGIRVQRGLFSTISETVPLARAQAVRKVQPLVWRPLGWCRLEVIVAGSPGKEQGTRSSRVTKSLLPVGSNEVADELCLSLLGLSQFQVSRPPGRARLKAPLSYHFLACGTDGAVVGASTGRLTKVTIWAPLAKVQSVRRVQGPVQRALRLETVHVDVAGRRVRAELRDRDIEEAGALFQTLVIASRAARRSAGSGAPGSVWRSCETARGEMAPKRSADSAAGHVSGGMVGQPLPPAPPGALVAPPPPNGGWPDGSTGGGRSQEPQDLGM